MKKYLPIGTVCTIKNDNNKYMVIGYKKNGYDYESLVFPGGSTNSQTSSYFNHEKIVDIYSLGYKNEESIQFIDTLLNERNNHVDLGNLIFDANGVVVAQGNEQAPKADNFGGLQFDANGVVIAQGNEQAPRADNFGGLQFDANGVVISQGE